jgi:nucleotide-binding universal stress UspA family protein
MLEGATVAIAVAAAGLRTEKDKSIASVSVAAGNADPAAIETATTLADGLGASLNGQGEGAADLFVVGSPGPTGRIGLSGLTRTLLNSARGSVLVVPHGTPVAL